jgi:hypothetical protein
MALTKISADLSGTAANIGGHPNQKLTYRVSEACELLGIGRTKLYAEIAAGKGSWPGSRGRSP